MEQHCLKFVRLSGLLCAASAAFIVGSTLSVVAVAAAGNSAGTEDAESSSFNLPSAPPLKSKNPTEKLKSDSLPIVVEAPPEKISAYLGQTLALKARAENRVKTANEPLLYAWILNGKIVCQTAECQIRLDGKDFKAGGYHLVFVAYNALGSQRTSHVLNIAQGTWKVGMPFNDKFKKNVPMIAYRSEASNHDKSKLWAETTSGNAVISYPGSVKLYGRVPRNLDWYGTVRTSNNGVYHIVDPGKAEWFFMDQTVAQMRKNSDVKLRTIRLNDGGARFFLGDRFATAAANSKKESKNEYLESHIINTPELTLVPQASSDIFVRRLNAENLDAGRKKQLSPELKNKFATIVTVISGQAKVNFSQGGTSKSLDIPAGVELVMFEGGTALPLNKPDPAAIDKMYKATFSPLDAIKKKVDIEGAKKINLAEHLKKIEEIIEREDYFDALGELSLVESRTAEDWRIPYYTGVAQKGLYQPAEAEKSLKVAAKQNPNTPLPHWQLGHIKLEEKKWADASQHFDEAHERMGSDDKLVSEYYYYSGVAAFQAQQGFASRSQFTRALWETQLENSLKGSSASFLGQITKQKPWSLVTPVGIQYDQNALGLGGQDDLPETFSKKSVARVIAGAIFTYDTYGAATKNGVYWGAGAKGIVIRNLSSEYKDQNAIVTGVQVMQTIRTQTADEKIKDSTTEQIVLTQGVDVLLLGESNDHFQDSFNFNANFKKFDLGITFERDAQATSDASRNALVFKQGYAWQPLEFLDAPLYLEEKYALKKNDSNAHSFSFNITPGYTQIFSMRQNIKYSILMGYKLQTTAPDKTKELKFNPTVTYSLFVTPWLLTTLAANYEYTRQTISEAKNVTKPGASLMFIGLF